MVRRSAGDALNDLGDPAALPAMAAALADPNKLVRWRAARFLFEQGGREDLPALAEAQDDPEFEVRMQVRRPLTDHSPSPLSGLPEQRFRGTRIATDS
jgi:HEAT repeat protein